MEWTTSAKLMNGGFQYVNTTTERGKDLGKQNEKLEIRELTPRKREQENLLEKLPVPKKSKSEPEAPKPRGKVHFVKEALLILRL